MANPKPQRNWTVQFRLETPGNIRYRKEIAIRESPATGGHDGPIFTQDDKHSDENELYTGQLNAATLTLHRMKELGRMATVRVALG